MSHEFASAVETVIGSFLYGSQLAKVWPSMSTSPVHWMYSSRPSSPSSIAARATNGLNVDPGG